MKMNRRGIQFPGVLISINPCNDIVEVIKQEGKESVVVFRGSKETWKSMMDELLSYTSCYKLGQPWKPQQLYTQK